MAKNWFILLLFGLIHFAYAEQQNLRKFIPAECDLLVGMNMKAVMEHPVIKGFLVTLKDDKAKQWQESGLTPEDVEFALIGGKTKELFALQEKKAQPELNFLSVCQVKNGVNLTKIYDVLKLKQANKVVLGELIGKQSIILTESDGKIYFVEISPNLIAIGTEEMVKKSIGLAGNSGESFEKNIELAKIAEGQNGLFWLVGQAPMLPVNKGDAPLDNPMNSLFKDLSFFSLNTNLNETGVILDVNLLCKTDEGANNLSISLQFLVGMLSANNKAPVRSEQIKIVNLNNSINIKITLDPNTLGKVVREAQKLAE